MLRGLLGIFPFGKHALKILPLLEGTDGLRKMSKSYGNHIALNDAPANLFGKLMKLSDELMWKYYQLLTAADVAALKKRTSHGSQKSLGRDIGGALPRRGGGQKGAGGF
jgi:tyrosyl-tRNA synthetase